MTTGSNIEPLPAAIPIETLFAQRGGMIARHWRGEYSLPRSYWVNGALIFGLGINMVFLVAMSVAMVALHKQPALMVAVCLGEMLLVLSAYIWALAGTWRAAGKYTGPRIWAILARLGLLMGVLVTIAHVSQDVSIISTAASRGSSSSSMSIMN